MIRRITLPLILLAIPARVFSAEPDADTLRVYFIGNSVTDTIKYDTLAEVAKARGYNLVWGRHVIPSAPLQWIWEHPKDGFQQQPFGYYPEALANFRWDVLCLQPFDRHLDGPDGDVAMAKKFIDLAVEKNPDVQVYIYERWPRKYVQGKPLAAKADEKAGKLDDYDAMWQAKYTGKWDGTNESKDYFDQLTRELRKAYPKLKINLVPVGQVLWGLNQWMKLGKVPGYTDVHQLYKDNIHLNDVGSYAVGCTFYNTFFKRNPGEPSADTYKVTDKTLASIVRIMAKRFVWYDELSGVADYFEDPAWRPIANVLGCDRITAIHVENLLAAHHIDCRIEGSILYGVAVSKKNAEKTIAILREDAPKRGYWIEFGVKDEIAPKTPPTEIRCLSAAQLVTRPEFAADKPLGKWLKCAEVSKKLRDYPFIELLEITEREYLATEDKSETGYDIELTLRPKAGNNSNKFTGSFQVWAQGDRIESDGGTEYKQ